MKRFTVCAMVAVMMALAGGARAEGTNAGPKLRLTLQLVDGSRIVGTPAIAALPLQTTYAKMDIPLDQVLTVKMADDHENAVIELRNGDKLKGVVSLPPLALETLFGKTAIGIEHIRQVDVVLLGANRANLVLWNQLGSEAEVKNSRVGPGGEYKAGRFVEGRFGQGVELNMQQQLGVSFPAGSVPQAEGCVEFWAKLVDFPVGIPEGPNPALMRVGGGGRVEDFTLELCLAPNDGMANGGVFVASALGCVGTGPYGGWTYARALGAENASGWHHYALVWKGAGSIPGVTDASRKIVVYVDGKLNTANGRSDPDVKALAASAEKDRLSLLGRATTSIAGTSVVFDNLKIWKYAKTDFSDRTEE